MPETTEFKMDKEYMEGIDKSLDEFEQQLGLPSLQPIQAPACLFLTLEELKKKTVDELNEASYQISQYAMYIQRTINKSKAWEAWARSKLDEVAASYIPKVPQGYGFNQVELIARNTPELCRRLNAFLRKIKMQSDRLWGVPGHIKIIADSIRDMKFVALKREKENTTNE